MKMGAEPKKLAVLVGLVAVAGAVYWMNSSSDAPTTSTAVRPVADPAAAAQSQAAGTSRVVKRRVPVGRPGSVGDKVFAPPVSVDATKVDPTLRLDLLAKVQAVGPEGGARNIFMVGAPPPPPGTVATGTIPKPPKIDVGVPQPEPPKVAATDKPPVTPGPPPAAPINLKYYGYSNRRSDGEKKAFFLDGEDVIVAAEGEIIKKQYKVVRIGVNSVQMEDTHSKSTQTLPMQQEAAPA